jgi:hypothetical protein
MQGLRLRFERLEFTYLTHLKRLESTLLEHQLERLSLGK